MARERRFGIGRAYIMNITGELKWHFGTRDFARLKFSESKEAFSVDMIMVPAKHRRQGIGKKLLQYVLLLADATHQPTSSTVRPIGASLDPNALEDLVEYYRKFGFEELDRGSTVVYMRRIPRLREEKAI